MLRLLTFHFKLYVYLKRCYLLENELSCIVLIQFSVESRLYASSSGVPYRGFI
jgi:hypothetical protein